MFLTGSTEPSVKIMLVIKSAKRVRKRGWSAEEGTLKVLERHLLYPETFEFKDVR